MLLELSDRIRIYTPPLLVVVGSLGNMTSLVVLSRLSRKVLSTCFYLAVLCVADLIVLYVRCCNNWIAYVTVSPDDVTGYDIVWSLMTHYDVICKSLTFAVSFTLHMSKWLVVATAVEGVIATGFPQRSYFD